MTLEASATIEIAATPQQVLEFVLDLDRYRQADTKIVRVGKITGPDARGRGEVRMWGRVKGMPPAPDVQTFELDRWTGLTFRGGRRQPARLVFDFVGTFECQDRSGGCRLTHAYRFDFTRPFRFLEGRLSPWLQDETEEELRKVRHLVEAASAT